MVSRGGNGAPDVLAWLRTFRPRAQTYRRSEYLRGGLGALVGIAIAGFTGKLLDVGPAMLPFIVAPIGASAVLLFAASASPLAQPWPVVGGNIVSTLIGVTAGRLIDDTAWAASVAVGVAIAAMMLLRCLHPPGGACALFAAVGVGVVHEQGFAFAVFPVAVNTVFVLLVAIVLNNLTGRRYPHAPETAQPQGGSVAAVERRLGLQTEDVRRAITRLDQGLDVLPDDVIELMRNAEAHALERQLGRLTVESVMARDVVTVQAFESLYLVRMTMTRNEVKAVPVIDADGRVVGIVTIYDLFTLQLANVDAVSTVMSSPVTTIEATAPLARLVAIMTDAGLRHVPVVDAGRLVGIVTRTELIAVLHRALLSAQGTRELSRAGPRCPAC